MNRFQAARLGNHNIDCCVRIKYSVSSVLAERVCTCLQSLGDNNYRVIIGKPDKTQQFAGDFFTPASSSSPSQQAGVEDVTGGLPVGASPDLMFAGQHVPLQTFDVQSAMASGRFSSVEQLCQELQKQNIGMSIGGVSNG